MPKARRPAIALMPFWSCARPQLSLARSQAAREGASAGGGNALARSLAERLSFPLCHRSDNCADERASSLGGAVTGVRSRGIG